MALGRGIETVRSPLVAFALAGALGGAIWALVPADPATARMLAITLGCIVCWILTPIPPAYTGVLGIGLLAVAFSPDLAFAGFQSPATWLIGFGLLMGEATRQSGLAQWTGSWITARSVPADARADPTRSYRRLLVALSIGAHALALLVPSALVRVLVLAPILRESGTHFADRNARVGIFLGPLFATFYGSSGILTADLPNIIITGFGRSVAGHDVAWSTWAVHMYPIMGIARVALVVTVVYLLFRPDSDTHVERIERDVPTVTGAERRTFLFLLVGGLVWVTDSLHGLHPVVGAIVVVVLAFLPGIGVADFESAIESVDISILFFVAAVLSIGEGLAATGFTDAASTSLLGLLPADASLVVVLAVVFAVTAALALLMEGLAVASVLTPVVIRYAEAGGLPLTPVLMAEAMALSSYFFPYQSAVLIAILAEGVADTGDLVRTTVACSVATIVLLLPAQFALFALLY